MIPTQEIPYFLDTFPLQYRTFQRTYGIEPKKSGLAIRVSAVGESAFSLFSLSDAHLRKEGQETFLLLRKAVVERTPSFLLRLLLEKNLLPKEGFEDLIEEFSSDGGADLALSHIIKVEENALVGQRCTKALHREFPRAFCPLSGKVMEDPVCDDHGHTFQRGAIQGYLRASGSAVCPLDRSREIRLLIASPRLKGEIKQTIEKIRDRIGEQERIPSFHLFRRTKTREAVRHLNKVQEYMAKGEYGNALKRYKSALRHTRKWGDYVVLPALYAKMGKSEEALIASLYLARYQLRAGKVEEMENTIRGQGNKDNGADKHARDALLYKALLKKDPYRYEVYSTLSQLFLACPTEAIQQRKVFENAAWHILYKGALHALERGYHGVAQSLANRAWSRYPEGRIGPLMDYEVCLAAGNDLRGEWSVEKREALKGELQRFLLRISQEGGGCVASGTRIEETYKIQRMQVLF